MSTLVSAPDRTALRPSALRRVAVAVTGSLACALPVAWGAGSVGALVSGTERDHRFHQLTGQGVLLAALWLVPLVALAVAGWRGRRPGAGAGLGHLALVVGAVLAAALAPGNGGLITAAIVVVTGGLVWLALPRRPRIARDGVDPVLAPVALAAAALFAPFAIGQSALQRAMADEHARLSHYFDMTWVAATIVLLLVAAAAVPAARRLALAGTLATLATLVVGGARFLFTGDGTWSLLALGLGIAAAAAVAFRLTRRPR